MGIKKLHIDSKTGFLNLEDLPHNCIFNKKITGCGATTIALRNGENYVIAVPTTELITNKTGLKEAGTAEMKEGPAVFGLFGTFSADVKKQLADYLATEGTKKIICTYDKVKHLPINEADFRLLVDEYHVLLKAYSYRETAIDGVLASFRDYKTFCFMSATPISPEFTPDILSGIDIVEAEWDETDILKVKLKKTNKPYMQAASYIASLKRGDLLVDGRKCDELFFFINSVADIAKILAHGRLKPEEVKIVCADTPGNRAKLKGYSISDSRSENKPFTFITCKSFEGVDYFSENGICIVVSNTHSSNTLLDISTDIPQIAGRIRTESNPFRNLIIHIFNTGGSRKDRRELNFNEDGSELMTWEEIVEMTNDEIESGKDFIATANKNHKNKKFGEKMLCSQYVIRNEAGEYIFNDMLVKLDLFTYKMEEQIYKRGINIKKEYRQNGIDASNIDYINITDSMENPVNRMIPFKDAFLQYAERRERLKRNPSLVMIGEDRLTEEQPLVVDAYDILGPDKVRSLKYLKKNVEAAIACHKSDMGKEAQMAKLIATKIKPNSFIPSKEAKRIIGECYATLDIDRAAKASDLDRWFKCRETRRYINNNTIRGFEIYISRIIPKAKQ